MYRQANIAQVVGCACRGSNPLGTSFLYLYYTNLQLGIQEGRHLTLARLPVKGWLNRAALWAKQRPHPPLLCVPTLQKVLAVLAPNWPWGGDFRYVTLNSVSTRLTIFILLFTRLMLLSHELAWTGCQRCQKPYTHTRTHTHTHTHTI